MKIISSRTNPTIKHICSLHTRKGRETHAQFIAEGQRIIQTLLASTYGLVQLYVTQDHFVNLACPAEMITIVTPEVMAKISSAKTPSGYLAVFTIPSKAQPKVEHAVVLAQVADPGNMGTLIRSAAAMGIQTVVIVQGADPWSPKVVQASAGTIGSVTVVSCSWQELITLKQDKKLCALVVKNGKSPQAVELKNTFLVIGNEARGIPDEWLNDCELRCTLPMPGNTESLNAAVAGSIALYLMATE